MDVEKDKETKRDWPGEQSKEGNCTLNQKHSSMKEEGEAGKTQPCSLKMCLAQVSTGDHRPLLQIQGVKGHHRKPLEQAADLL